MVELLISSQFRVFFHITLLFYQSSVTLFSREQKKKCGDYDIWIYTHVYMHIENKEWLKGGECLYVRTMSEWMDG